MLAHGTTLEDHHLGTVLETFKVYRMPDGRDRSARRKVHVRLTVVYATKAGMCMGILLPKPVPEGSP